MAGPLILPKFHIIISMKLWSIQAWYTAYHASGSELWTRLCNVSLISCELVVHINRCYYIVGCAWLLRAHNVTMVVSGDWLVFDSFFFVAFFFSQISFFTLVSVWTFDRPSPPLNRCHLRLVLCHVEPQRSMNVLSGIWETHLNMYQ